MFKAGDAIIHPIRGAGVVVRIEERQWRGSDNLYYKVKLLSQPATKLMIPVNAAETLGLRPAIPRSKLGQVWRVLHSTSGTLPADHKERYQFLEGKLHAGDVLQVAEAVRDIAWRQQQGPNLTTQDKRIYEEGITLLTGEIAATQDIPLMDAEAEVRAKLREGLASATTV
jgi:RNA polymerase-interacting CarD/CdnL/TRCF family regulator